MIAKSRSVYFLFCADCSYHKDTAKIIRESSFMTIDEIRNNLSKFKCSECGSKDIVIKEKPTAERIIEYVATEQTTDRVFHRSTCGWMKNVSAENEIRFRNRESAIKRGFRSCTSCRP